MISQRKKQPPKPEEVQQFEARISQACMLMQDDPNLRLLLNEYMVGEQNKMGTEALTLLESARSPEQFTAAQALAIGRAKLRDFRDRLIKLGNDARKESEKPQEKKP